VGESTDKADVARFRENLLAEYDAVALYERLAKAETNADLAKVYLRLAETERQHAEVWAGKLHQAGQPPPPSAPSFHVRLLGWMAARFGTGLVLPTIVGIEQRANRAYDNQSDAVALGLPGDERSHARIFRYLSRITPGLEGSAIARFEGRHRAIGGNALRAAVLGANDGLLSVFGLVMGVAGAARSTSEILLTGVAGLVAGASSMALGEWISVQSSREFYEHQLKIEKSELSMDPEAEAEELALIYEAKGVEAQEAQRLAHRLVNQPTNALDTLAREELSIDPKELGGSAWEAALMSFGLFAVGAIIPVFPYLLWHGTAGIVGSGIASACGLFMLGAFITLITGRNPILSGLRMMLLGLVAAAVTFGIGRLIGVSLG